MSGGSDNDLAWLMNELGLNGLASFPKQAGKSSRKTLNEPNRVIVVSHDDDDDDD
jgi:hypothetical protein